MCVLGYVICDFREQKRSSVNSVAMHEVSFKSIIEHNNTCVLLSSVSEDLNYLVQVCLIRFRAELCRKVDLQEQDWARLL